VQTSPDLDRWTKGRALLFIHGTFSNAHGGFYDLPPEFMAKLHRLCSSEAEARV
jgi:hypothetical protein